MGEYLVHPNDHVNRSQSTNDVIPTAIRLGALRLLDGFLGTVIELSDALESRAEAFDDVLKTGRTHLQDAVPLTLAGRNSAGTPNRYGVTLIGFGIPLITCDESGSVVRLWEQG